MCRSASSQKLGANLQNETNVLKRIQLCLSPFGCRLFRNQRYVGQIVKHGKITNAWANCGVGGDGGADLIGWQSVLITPEMVGRRVALFLAIEGKDQSLLRKEQKDFIAAVLADGGKAGHAHNEEEAKCIIANEN